MERSKIEWCDHTWNPWRGCTKVSDGCAHCYAETLSRRNPKVLGVWGKGKPRVRAVNSTWRQPLKWNEQAIHFLECHRCGWRGLRRPDAVCPTPGCLTFFSEMASVQPRVFCASLADWLDDEVPIEWLADLLDLIRGTTNLAWLLLTKRPENWHRRLEAVLRGPAWTNYPLHRFVEDWLAATAPGNVWMGTTVENQRRANERIPLLLSIPAKVRFLSCEPLLERVEFSNVSGRSDWLSASGKKALTGIDWVIAGGESGPGARPMHPAWARSLRDQCAAAGVAFLFKQWGEWAPDNGEGTKGEWHGFRDGQMLKRVGKKSAGRLLDGREWNEMPTALTEMDWPAEPGIWMAWIEGMDCWFPLRARLLKEYPADVPHLPMPIIAQYPESEKNWPYTFKGCHPVKRWRQPTAEELAKAQHFYGQNQSSPAPGEACVAGTPGSPINV